MTPEFWQDLDRWWVDHLSEARAVVAAEGLDWKSAGEHDFYVQCALAEQAIAELGRCHVRPASTDSGISNECVYTHLHWHANGAHITLQLIAMCSGVGNVHVRTYLDRPKP